MTLISGPSSSNAVFVDQVETSATVMENCGAYLSEWRPVDCGDEYYFAISADGNTISKDSVVLNRGYDYPYTFDYTVPRPRGEAPQLVNIDGVWGIPENWGILPEGSQSTLRITLIANNKILPTKERYIDVVSLSQNVNSKDLPAEVRRYLASVDGSGAGAYGGTTIVGREGENSLWRYRKSDSTYIPNTWLEPDDKQYYMNEQGVMLAGAITPDGYYVNIEGEKTSYIPGRFQDGVSWKYVRRNGYCATNQWTQDVDGKWYYFDTVAVMLVNVTTLNSYYVDASGVWDGQSASAVTGGENPGPGVTTTSNTEG